MSSNNDHLIVAYFSQDKKSINVGKAGHMLESMYALENDRDVAIPPEDSYDEK